ncbi:MAG: PDZ domain-containing protein, partial [Nitrospira sp.]|nr:PDZ domain-containing protein [Nitrospira sp.]
IGFAIPIDSAKRIVKSLIAGEKILYGWIGVSVQDLSPELAKSFNMDIVQGALIADVAKDGQADKAGLKRGDVVIAYKGIEMPDSRTFLNRAAGSPIGEKVQLMRMVGHVRQKSLDIPEATPIVQEKISTGIAGLF